MVTYTLTLLGVNILTSLELKVGRLWELGVGTLLSLLVKPRARIRLLPRRQS